MTKAFDDIAPSGQELTEYDRSHVKLYMRLLDAAADGAHWEEAVQSCSASTPPANQSVASASMIAISPAPAG